MPRFGLDRPAKLLWHVWNRPGDWNHRQRDYLFALRMTYRILFYRRPENVQKHSFRFPGKFRPAGSGKGRALNFFALNQPLLPASEGYWDNINRECLLPN